jgi:dinuclear metal center YbgI/SA1388 family protein
MPRLFCVQETLNQLKIKGKKLLVIGDVIRIMEAIAPKILAQDWDNSGLQIGSLDWPVERIMVALDPTVSVVRAACDKKIDLLITHHPLIFKAIKSIDFKSPLGQIIELATRHHLGVFSAHSNLDSVSGGLNDVFLEKIGLIPSGLLCPDKPIEFCKLTVYVPLTHCQKILDAFFELDICSNEDYTCCTFRHQGIGTFKPGALANPFIGKPGGDIVHVDEVKIEARIRKNVINKAIDLIRSCHPYETMAYDIYPLHSDIAETGFGRLGRLDTPVPFSEFAAGIKSRFNLRQLKVSGPSDLLVNQAAVCTGSGSSLMPYFLSSSAQVFITGDLKYHDAIDAQMHRKCLIDVGHFASERIMIELVCDRLITLLRKIDAAINVEAWDQENDPFDYI